MGRRAIDRVIKRPSCEQLRILPLMLGGHRLSLARYRVVAPPLAYQLVEEGLNLPRRRC